MKLEERIKSLIEEGDNVTFLKNSYTQSHGRYGSLSANFREWNAKVEDLIIKCYGYESGPMKLLAQLNLNAVAGNYENEFNQQHGIVMGAIRACQSIPVSETKLTNNISYLSIIFDKFHTVAIQLRSRYNNRTTIDIQDEYDVQDVLHVLLKLHFNDIRKEEWTPSYAGGSSRMDFLLKEEKTVIEVKKTRLGLDDKELGKQLIIDRARYNHIQIVNV